LNGAPPFCRIVDTATSRGGACQRAIAIGNWDNPTPRRNSNPDQWSLRLLKRICLAAARLLLFAVLILRSASFSARSEHQQIDDERDVMAECN
jgi:hypothetical protein